MKVTVTIDDIRLKSNLKINQTLIFNKKFFHTILGFTRSRSYPLDDIDGFHQLIAGSYKGDKPFNVTGIDKVHSNVTVLMEVLLTEFENQFCIYLLLVHLKAIKFIRNLELNFLKG